MSNDPNFGRPYVENEHAKRNRLRMEADEPMRLKIVALMSDHLFTQPPIGDMNFANGGSYIQHHPEALKGLKEKALAFSYEHNASYANVVERLLCKGDINDTNDVRLLNLAHRYFSEDEDSVSMGRLYSRLSNIDWDDATEWGQGYFSFGDGRGSAHKKVCLNPGEAQAMWEARELQKQIPNQKAGSISLRM